MMFTTFLLLVPWLAHLTLAQDIGLDATHNATSLMGTWSSGSKKVQTGAGFANPANRTFVYPPTSGISYSFTDDGFYEVAKYRFNGNGSEPTCITGVLVWHHGSFSLLPNGSMTLTPLSDGYQQIQDPCAAQSNFIEPYDIPELLVQWRIFQDPTQGYKLHLFQFDGAPLAPQFQVSTTPNMLPTRLLRNDTNPDLAATSATPSKNIRRSPNSASDFKQREKVAGAVGMVIIGAMLSVL